MNREQAHGTGWLKTIANRYGVYSGDPTSQQLELLAEVQGRMNLVVKTRWMLLVLLSIYGLYAAAFFTLSGNGVSLSGAQMVVLTGSFIAVFAYNIFYQKFYRQLSQIRFINHLQILLDIFFVSILIHYSGGVLSWFWTVYLILTLEATYLLEKKSDSWFIGAVGGLIYGALLTAEFYGIIPPVRMPMIDPALQHNFLYEMLMWFWVSIMNATVAIIGSFLMGVIRERERELKLMVILDQMTNLYNRGYFFKMLNSEIQRSMRYNRVFSLILIDVDDFKRFNDTHGHLEGDRLLKQIARTFRENVRRSETDPSYDVDVPCRYGGEEFAIILPETTLAGESEGGQNSTGVHALAFAERIRAAIEALDLNGYRVTASIGAAAYPAHGTDPDALVKAADDALYRAKKTGKNRVEVAQ